MQPSNVTQSELCFRNTLGGNVRQVREDGRSGPCPGRSRGGPDSAVGKAGELMSDAH